MAKNCASSEASDQGNDVAVYPSQISYPNGKYRIRFVLSAPGVRTDFDPAWNTLCANVRFQRSLLSQLVIEHLSAGGSWEQVRSYLFTYGYGAGNIFPNLFWPHPASNHFTPSLLSVQEVGADNSPLPATTFRYGDAMYLTAADNGYKGQVEFDYSGWYADYGPRQGWDQANGACAAYGWQAGSATTLVCQSSQTRGLYFKSTTSGNNGVVWTTKPFSAFRPGGAYLIHAQVEQWGSTEPLQQVRVG